MPKPWTEEEKREKLAELKRLYVMDGKTISEVGKILGISQQTVFQRLTRFGIPSNIEFKRRRDIIIPKTHSPDLAEFFGIMLGDGHLTHFQVQVNLGTKEMTYAESVVDLIASIFGARPKICTRKTGYRDVYMGSVTLTEWLKREGLVFNKVAAQVDAPRWIFSQQEYMKKFIRGFFDTDGSVYRLRWGTQVEFTNESLPLLKSVRSMLICLGYTPSRVSGYKVYLTRREQVKKFFTEVNPRNSKHTRRFMDFCKS